VSQLPPAIGPYQVLRRLGGGGMGEVFLAHDPRLGRQVAIKRIRAEVGFDPSRRARFRREARLIAGLNHPAIVQVFDLWSEGDVDHIVMEYVPGASLRETLKEGPLPLDRGLAIAVSIAEGLAYAHRQDVVHRDLKTENVLLTPEGDAKIVDFGIARRLLGEPGEETLTMEGAVLGTCRTMAPEQASGEPSGPRSDLFSFGVLLYELFTGRSPFLAKTHAATLQRILDPQDRPQPVCAVAPGVPQELSSLIDQLLEKVPVFRPRDAEEVLHRLRELASTADGERQETATLPPTVPERSGGTPEVHWSPHPSVPRGEAASAPVRRGTTARQRWLLAVVALGVALLVVMYSRRSGPVPPRPDPEALLHVAVLKSEYQGGPPSVETQLLALAIRDAIQTHLRSLDRVVLIDPTQVDFLSGELAEIAEALAVDEVVRSTFSCQRHLCDVQVERVQFGGLRSKQEFVAWDREIEVPFTDSPQATRKIAGLIQEGYAELRSRPGTTESVASDEDRKDYLQIELALGENPDGWSRRQIFDRLREIRERSPKFVAPHLLEAQLAINEYSTTHDPKQRERALERVKSAQEIAPNDLEVCITLVWVQYQAELFHEAKASLVRCEQQAPDEIRVLDLKARLLAKDNRPEALDTYSTVVKRQPSWFRWYEYAKLAWQQGEIDLAREALDSLFAIYPDNALGLQLRATIELTNGDPESAVERYEQLTASTPDRSALVNLGLARMLLHEYDGAAEVIQQAVQGASHHGEIHLGLADARWLQGRQGEAKRLYHRVLELSENAAGEAGWKRPMIRAQALAHLGQRQEAVKELQEALGLAPEDSGDAAYEAALVYALVGERESAVKYARKARELGWSRHWFRLPWFDDLHKNPDFRALLQESESSKDEAAPPS
jgi:serine/threonine-protein kinase